MKVTVKYFAAVREATGKNEEVVETTAKNPSELLDQLKRQYPINFQESDLKVALNEEYVAFSNSLQEQDTIVFMPPVAGG